MKEYQEILLLLLVRYHFKEDLRGFLSFTAKTKLIEHYERTLGAYHFGNHLMILETKASSILVEKYFKNA
jgi:hypothetical protein